MCISPHRASICDKALSTAFFQSSRLEDVHALYDPAAHYYSFGEWQGIDLFIMGAVTPMLWTGDISLAVRFTPMYSSAIAFALDQQDDGGLGSTVFCGFAFSFFDFATCMMSRQQFEETFKNRGVTTSTIEASMIAILQRLNGGWATWLSDDVWIALACVIIFLAEVRTRARASDDGDVGDARGDSSADVDHSTLKQALARILSIHATPRHLEQDATYVGLGFGITLPSLVVAEGYLWTGEVGIAREIVERVLSRVGLLGFYKVSFLRKSRSIWIHANLHLAVCCAQGESISASWNHPHHRCRGRG
jgi:hypothetical protein